MFRSVFASRRGWTRIFRSGAPAAPSHRRFFNDPPRLAGRLGSRAGALGVRRGHGRARSGDRSCSGAVHHPPVAWSFVFEGSCSGGRLDRSCSRGRLERSCSRGADVGVVTGARACGAGSCAGSRVHRASAAHRRALREALAPATRTARARRANRSRTRPRTDRASTRRLVYVARRRQPPREEICANCDQDEGNAHHARAASYAGACRVALLISPRSRRDLSYVSV